MKLREEQSEPTLGSSRAWAFRGPFALVLQRRFKSKWAMHGCCLACGPKCTRSPPGRGAVNRGTLLGVIFAGKLHLSLLKAEDQSHVRPSTGEE